MTLPSRASIAPALRRIALASARNVWPERGRRQTHARPRECRAARERLARHLELLQRHLVDVGRPVEASAVQTELRLLEEVGACCSPRT